MTVEKGQMMKFCCKSPLSIFWPKLPMGTIINMKIKHLLLSCWTKDTNKRPTMNEIFNIVQRLQNSSKRKNSII